MFKDIEALGVVDSKGRVYNYSAKGALVDINSLDVLNTSVSTGVKKPTYKDILETATDFLSLDISKRSTGWVMWYNRELTYGCYHVNAKEDRGIKKEFSIFLRNLIGNKVFSVIYVEDTIGGCNYKTSKVLTELNTVVDDLMNYDMIKESPIDRVVATVWKKYLRLISPEDIAIRGANDKEEVAFILNQLGFSLTKAEVKKVGGSKADSYQDIYDALGMALGMISSGVTNKVKAKKVKKVSDNLEKGYKLIQCKNRDDLKKNCRDIQKRQRNPKEIYYITYDSQYRDLAKQFKKVVYEYGDDFIFGIEVPLSKVGSILITQDFDISQDIVYFIAKRR